MGGPSEWRGTGRRSSAAPSGSPSSRAGTSMRCRWIGRVILRDYITLWRERASWSEDFQVEQDPVISYALVAMFSDPVLAEGFAFRGGMALYPLKPLA